MKYTLILLITLLFINSYFSYTRIKSIKSRKFDLKSSNLISNQPFQQLLADKLISTAFSIPVLYKLARDNARSMLIKRGQQIDVDWQENIKKYNNNLEKLVNIYDNIYNNKIKYPDYYLKPFHAYDDGNLSWEAAMEVESAALTVHAPIFSTDNKQLDRNGDFMLRDNYHKCMLQSLNKHDFKPKKILDIGCSTGLSTIKLHESFPNVEIFGIDLSPYMLAVAKQNLESIEYVDAKQHIQYIHSKGEDIEINEKQINLISMCLVLHELPTDISKQIFTQAYDILPNNGVFSIMDMNPLSTHFIKLASNPFAFSAFKSTEPWLQEYVSMDLIETLKYVGFKEIDILYNSPRHRTVVAYK